MCETPLPLERFGVDYKFNPTIRGAARRALIVGDRIVIAVVQRKKLTDRQLIATC